ncbi:MAG: helix-turn-helix domain-containing protein [Verrucomicrobia bacterium]|nr:helix-turn-helix domain-containing protein [Verrucomicrobiota bacterium]
MLDFKSRVAGGESLKRAARAMGLPLVSLKRWTARYEKEGFAGLVDGCRRSGRDSVAEKLRKACGEAAWELTLTAVRALALDLDGSAGAAWRQFARIGGEIKTAAGTVRLDAPLPVRDYFAAVGEGRRSKHSISKSLLHLVKPTPILNAAHRGHRQFSLRVWTPRRLDILPGDVFTSDDTTPIWAWWVPWPESKEYPFGCKVLQGQFLPVIDVASQQPLAFALIAREKSSYRAADIWALFGYVFDHFGLPRLGVQLERGSWEATLVAGAKVEYASGEASHTQRVGGLRMLPTNVLPWHEERLTNPELRARLLGKTLKTWTSYLPKSKSIEAFFNRSQKLEGTLWGCLGRDQMRRPFEKAKKIFEACKRGVEDPRLHFLRGDEMASRLRDLMTYYAGERIEGEVFYGKPEQVWTDAMAEHGDLLRLPEDQRYLFRRDWSLCKITQGWVKPSRMDETTGRRISYFYQNPSLFAERDSQQVIVYFDREDFESPAQIHDLDGRHLGEAEYFSRKGMFLEGEMDGHEARRLYAGAVMTIYAQIAPHCPSRQLPSEIATRRKTAAMEARWQDGRGASARAQIASNTPSLQDSNSSAAETGEGQDLTIRQRPVDPVAPLQFSMRGTAPADSTDVPRHPQLPVSSAVPLATFDREAAAKLIAQREAEARERGELLET